MDLTSIYRIECEKCGRGPYICDCDPSFRQDIQRYSSTDKYLRKHPGMLIDIGGYKAWGENFHRLHSGCLTEEMLQSWFSDLLEEIMVYPWFKLAIYEVPTWIDSRSGKQVFFFRDSLPTYTVLRCGTQFL
jgi:hypothetical protein